MKNRRVMAGTTILVAAVLAIAATAWIPATSARRNPAPDGICFGSRTNLHVCRSRTK